jgi:hypothetical protein
MDTEEQIIAGEFLSKLGNKKSKVVVQLICDYLTAHPEAKNPKETLKFIINSTSLGDKITDIVKSIIQTELADKMFTPPLPDSSGAEQTVPAADESIDDMLSNLDLWNNQ